MVLIASQAAAPAEKASWRQNSTVRLQAALKCLDSGSVGASPGTLRPKLPTFGLSDLLLDSHWGSVRRAWEAGQLLPAWVYCPALWNMCASESRGLGMIAT